MRHHVEARRGPRATAVEIHAAVPNANRFYEHLRPHFGAMPDTGLRHTMNARTMAAIERDVQRFLPNTELVGGLIHRHYYMERTNLDADPKEIHANAFRV